MAESSGWGAVAGAATSALGNYAVGVAANKRQWKYQQQAMEKQQTYNKELWDYQNAYNTPQAQMERLEAAGLNPRLIYGDSGAVGNNSGAIAPTEVPARQAQRGEVPDLYRERLIARQMDAQYKATTQNIESAKVKAALDEQKTALENLKVMREGLRSKNYKALADAEIETQKFIALRSSSLYANEKSKGNLMDQMFNFRTESNKQTIEAGGLEIAFKKNRNALADLGIYASDDPKIRILIQAANRLGIDLDDLIKRGYENLKYLFK